jgi:hypothetical protein
MTDYEFYSNECGCPVCGTYLIFPEERNGMEGSPMNTDSGYQKWLEKETEALENEPLIQADFEQDCMEGDLDASKSND